MPRLIAGLCVVCVLVVAGCGDGKGKRTGSPGSTSSRVGGTLRIAVPSVPRNLDPLANRRIDQLQVVGQVFEPLVARYAAPEGRLRRAQGLALGWRRARGGRFWHLSLRRGVKFQNRSSLSVASTAANFRRWQATSAGRQLLPGLRRITTTGQTSLRLTFRSPIQDLPRRLASPQLGLVGPYALRPVSGRAASFKGASLAGSGPFIVSRLDAGRQVLLDRSNRWWGSRQGLGPSLDRVVFRALPAEGQRLAAFDSGKADVATNLTAAAVVKLKARPDAQTLLMADGSFAAVRRSVRGYRPSRVLGQPQAIVHLSGVWLTRTGA